MVAQLHAHVKNTELLAFALQSSPQKARGLMSKMYEVTRSLIVFDSVYVIVPSMKHPTVRSGKSGPTMNAHNL